MQNVQRRQLNSVSGKNLMQKVANSSVVRSNFSTILDEVQFNQDSYVIERKGQPAAAIVPLSIYENWKRSREQLFEMIVAMQERSGNHDPDAIMDLVVEAQQAVRKDVQST